LQLQNFMRELDIINNTLAAKQNANTQAKSGDEAKSGGEAKSGDEAKTTAAATSDSFLIPEIEFNRKNLIPLVDSILTSNTRIIKDAVNTYNVKYKTLYPDNKPQIRESSNLAIYGTLSVNDNGGVIGEFSNQVNNEFIRFFDSNGCKHNLKKDDSNTKQYIKNVILFCKDG
jgi:hypothetical protein